MSEMRYMISDAAKKVEVEAHVLRYWEEELDMTISRNEMGHRYYTNEDIQAFLNIKELKEKGFQLKAIKMMLPDLHDMDVRNMDHIYELKEEMNTKVEGEVMKGKKMEIAAAQNDIGTSPTSNNDKMQQFQMILGNIIQQTIQENNKVICKEVGDQVSTTVLKEMDYLMQRKEKREEDRYQKLDETIRNFQRARQEAAAATAEGEGKKKKEKGLFNRKKKKQNQKQKEKLEELI